MQLQVEAKTPTQAHVTVKVPAGDVQREFDTAYRSLARRVSLPGFRRGRIPMTHLRKRYGQQVSDDVMQALISRGWREAIDEHALEPVGEPEIDAGPAKHGIEYSFSFTVEVSPKIDLGSYSKLPVELAKYTVPDAQVHAEFDALVARAATWEAITDRDASEEGDMVVIDYVGRIGGEIFEGGTGNDAELILGSGHFLPDFEQQCLNRAVGETFELTTTFPDDYKGPVAGQTAVFDIAVKALRTRVLPPLDDALAEQFGAESVEKLRQQVRERIEAIWQRNAEREAHNKLREVIAERYDFEVPATMLARATADRKQRDHDHDHACDESAHEASAARELRVDFVLDAIASTEGIEVDEREVNQTIEVQARSMGQFAPQFLQMYRHAERRAALARGLRHDKVLDYLLSKADITEVPREVPTSDHGPQPETP